RLFQLLDEQALAARLVEPPVLQLVTGGGHRRELDGESGMQGLEPRLDVLGLPQRKRALARRDDQALHRARLIASAPRSRAAAATAGGSPEAARPSRRSPPASAPRRLPW